MHHDNVSIVLAYYKAINEKKPDLAVSYLDEQVVLTSPMDQKQGKAAVTAAVHGFCSVICDLSIRSEFSKGNQVMLAYDITFPLPIGHLAAAGLLTLEQGLITHIELYYDSRILLSQKDAIFSSSAPRSQ